MEVQGNKMRRDGMRMVKRFDGCPNWRNNIDEESVNDEMRNIIDETRINDVMRNNIVKTLLYENDDETEVGDDAVKMHIRTTSK